MNVHLILVVAFVRVSTLAYSQVVVAEPAELTAIRARYYEEISKVNKPVTTRYVEYLRSLKSQMEARGERNGALAVQQEIESLALDEHSDGDQHKIVVWNTHNADFNDRGTRFFNLIVYSGGKEVWRKNEVEIAWVAGEDTSVTIPLPAVRVDKIRVEITGMHKGSAGLAEIEYWKDGKNLAKKRRVTVSSVFEGSTALDGDKLTDGITTSKQDRVGYWVMSDGELGWAEIHLR